MEDNNSSANLSGLDTQINNVIEKVINKLQPLETSSSSDTRLFFPRGIELIYIKIKGDLTTKPNAEVELKIAGPTPPSADEFLTVSSSTEDSDQNDMVENDPKPSPGPRPSPEPRPSPGPRPSPEPRPSPGPRPNPRKQK